MHENTPEVLTTAEAAAYLRCSPKTLNTWRSRGGGPPFVKVGAAVRYRRSTLDQWLADREQASTAGGFA